MIDIFYYAIIIFCSLALIAIPAGMILFVCYFSGKDNSSATTPPNKDIWGAAGELPSRSPNKNIWG